MGLPEFLNDALGQCGFARVTAIDDGTVNANWCQTFYPKLRRAGLSLARWSFAETRLQLVQNVTPPAFEFAYSYAVPSDMLIIREYNGATLTPSAVDPNWWYAMAGRYKIESGNLYSNEGEVKIVYTRDETNVEKWSDLFYQMLSTWLASKLAMAIGKDSAKSSALYNQAIALGLPLAAAIDGQQGTVTPYVVDDLTWGR